MKIMQILFSLASGGAERFVVDLSNQLSIEGHQVVICVLRKDEGNFSFNKQFVQPSVRILFLGLSRGISLSKILQVERCIRRENPDIVHCHLNVVPYIFRIALIDKKIRFFHTLHNVASYASGTAFQKNINRFFYRHHYIFPVTISTKCQDSYCEFYGLRAPCIENGRSPVAPTDKLSMVRAEVNSYMKSKNTIVFVHVARFSAQKNQSLLIDTFNQLYIDGIDFVLLVIGNNFDTEEARLLRSKACPSILFLGEKANVGDYLLCSDAFCLTSLFEGLPISLLEALSCGVVPICTAVGGIPDVITDGITGFLAAEVTVPSYYAAVMRFLSSKIDKSMLVDIFEKKYSISKCAKQYIALYEKSFQRQRYGDDK